MVWLERLELPTTESIHCQQRNPQENQATKSNHTNPIRSYRILLHSRWTHASSSSVSPKDRPYILAWNWRDSLQNKLYCIHIETYFTVRQLSWSQGNFVKQGSPQQSNKLSPTPAQHLCISRRCPMRWSQNAAAKNCSAFQIINSDYLNLFDLPPCIPCWCLNHVSFATGDRERPSM